jgi:hypothetical protein
MRSSKFCLSLLLIYPIALSAQWLNAKDPKVPRLPDGKPNLTAPAPRVAGKPDLSGIWVAEGSPRKELAAYNLPSGENGLGEFDATLHFINFFSDYPRGQEPMQPAAAQLFRDHAGAAPPTLCPPPAIPIFTLAPEPFKIVQTPGLVLFLYESTTNFRQILIDKRTLSPDPLPTWMGYSSGKWEGDWLVVDTVGLDERAPLDAMGHPHSSELKLHERFRRRDFGHIDIETTIDDPKFYTKPVTLKNALVVLPDTELIESFCSEGERDLVHMRGQGPGK